MHTILDYCATIIVVVLTVGLCWTATMLFLWSIPDAIGNWENATYHTRRFFAREKTP